MSENQAHLGDENAPNHQTSPFGPGQHATEPIPVAPSPPTTFPAAGPQSDQPTPPFSTPPASTPATSTPPFSTPPTSTAASPWAQRVPYPPAPAAVDASAGGSPAGAAPLPPPAFASAQPPHSYPTYAPSPQPWATAPIPVGPGPASGPVGPASGPVSAPRGGGVGRVAVAAVAAGAIALAAGGVGGFVGYALHGENKTPVQNVQNVGTGVAAPVVDRSSLAQIAAKVQPTVVVIQTQSGEGSGVITTADGLIVTNNHVVSGARGDTVSVTFNSGKRVDGSIVGTDPRTDLAVVKAQGVSGLTFATWGNSDDVQVGDTVLAIGSPLGLQGSVTAGIVSALHRTITVGGDQSSPFGNSSTSGTTTIGDAIQTDAPINPGNSGGALVNTKSEVIGINSAIATSGSTGNIGVGFAISANKAKSVTDQLIKGGKVSHPFLGVRMVDAQSGGAQVQSVETGSPAEKANLKVGDVVTKINGRPVVGSEDVVAAVQSGKVGGQMQLTVVRDGTEQAVTVTLGEAP